MTVLLFLTAKALVKVTLGMKNKTIYLIKQKIANRLKLSRKHVLNIYNFTYQKHYVTMNLYPLSVILNLALNLCIIYIYLP